MTLAFDPGNDFADVADLARDVTLVRPDASDSTVLACAVRAAIRTSEARGSGGRYTEEDVVWNLGATELDKPPLPGDVIVEGDARWTILSARHTATGRWRCVCRNLVIAHGLDQHVDVEVAVYTKDAAGASTATWHPWRTGVAARIQPVRSLIANEHDRRTVRRELTVFMAESLALDHTHRIKAPDGMTYRIVGCRKAERIDALMEVDVVQEGLGIGD